MALPGLARILEPFCRLETSRPRVFAIGDVRAGSTKRVAAAVGEGAAVVAQIHSVLVSPRIVAAIAGGTAPADLTVTGLAKALLYSWAEQERDIGLVRCDSANAWRASAAGSLPNRSLAHLEPAIPPGPAMPPYATQGRLRRLQLANT